MTSRRNYRKNLTMTEALAELDNCSGSQFDPVTVQYFTKSIVDFVTTNTVFSREYLDNFDMSEN